MVARSSGGSKSEQRKAQHEAEELKKTHIWMCSATRIVVCVREEEVMFRGVVRLRSKGRRVAAEMQRNGEANLRTTQNLLFVRKASHLLARGSEVSCEGFQRAAIEKIVEFTACNRTLV